jgi:hypothetical protein
MKEGRKIKKTNGQKGKKRGKSKRKKMKNKNIDRNFGRYKIET